MRGHASALLVFMLSTAIAEAAVPTTVTMHGRLLASDTPVEGDVNLTFLLYDGLSASTAFWQESQIVTCVGGYYTAVLGTVTPMLIDDLAVAAQPMVGISVDGAPELTPRLGISSVPYAMAAGRAQVADDLECDRCVSATAVNFNYAFSNDSAGAAADLDCSNCIDNAELANEAVSTSKIADATITEAKIADQAVTYGKLAGCNLDVDGQLVWDGSSEGQRWTCKPFTIDVMAAVVGATCSGSGCSGDETVNAVHGTRPGGSTIAYNVDTSNTSTTYVHDFDLGAIYPARRVDVMGYSTGCWAEDGHNGGCSHNDNSFRFFWSLDDVVYTEFTATAADSCAWLDDGCWIAFDQQPMRYLRLQVSSSCSGCSNHDYVDFFRISG